MEQCKKCKYHNNVCRFANENVNNSCKFFINIEPSKSAEEFRDILGYIKLLVENGSNESDLKYLWNSLSEAITNLEQYAHSKISEGEIVPELNRLVNAHNFEDPMAKRLELINDTAKAIISKLER